MYDDSQVSNPDDLTEEQLEQLLFTLNNDVLIFESEIEPAKAEKSAIEQQIKAERQAFEARIQQLNTAAYAIEQQTYEIRRQLNRKRAELESTQRQIEAAKRRKLAEDSFKMLETKWSEVFERFQSALPHQTEGARKMASRRRMILADTMGLGKTYTVLITLDLIKSATEEATPEHPVEYESW